MKLRQKQVVKVDVNGIDCIATLDADTIDKFQEEYGIGIFQAFSSIKDTNGGDGVVYKLICTMIKRADNNEVLGYSYFNQFLYFDVLASLSDVVVEAIVQNMPESKGTAEKK